MSIEYGPFGDLLIFPDEDGATQRRLERGLRPLLAELHDAAAASGPPPALTSRLAGAVSELGEYMEDHADEVFYFMPANGLRKELADALLDGGFAQRFGMPAAAEAHTEACRAYLQIACGCYRQDCHRIYKEGGEPGRTALAAPALGMLGHVAAACDGALAAIAPPGWPLPGKLYLLCRELLDTVASEWAAVFDSVAANHPALRPLAALALRVVRDGAAHPASGGDIYRTRLARGALGQLEASVIQAARAGRLDLEPLLVGAPAHLLPPGLARLAAVAGQD